MKLKAVLFDVDGVLLDSIGSLIKYLKKTAKIMKLKTPSDTDIRLSFGLSWYDCIKKLWPNINIEHFKKVDKKLWGEYPIAVKPFKDAIKSVSEIKKMGIKIGIFTMGGKEYAYEYLAKCGYDTKLFDCIITRDDVKRPRPHPDGIFLACKEMKVKPRDVLYIGDTIYDFETAKRAKVNYASVTCGTLTKDILIKNDVPHLIKNVSELPKLIKNKELFFVKKTVSCLVMLNNKILILKRSDKKGLYKNKWSVVNGHIEDKEKPLETAYKEIEEETGLDVELIRAKKPFFIRDDKYSTIWHSHPFLFRTKTDKVRLNWEHTQYKWIDSKEVRKYDTTPGLWKVVNGLLEK